MERVTKENLEIEALRDSTSKEKDKVMSGGGVNDAAEQWKIFTSQSRYSDKGMGIKFLALVILEGCPTARLERLEVEKVNNIWTNSLIVYIVGVKSYFICA